MDVRGGRLHFLALCLVLLYNISLHVFFYLSIKLSGDISHKSWCLRYLKVREQEMLLAKVIITVSTNLCEFVTPIQFRISVSYLMVP